MSEAEAFVYDEGQVAPGETERLRYAVSETYLGDPIRIPVTIINGCAAGPTVFLSAAVHGDELNGIEVVREIAEEWDHENLHGTLVCLPVLNVHGFLTQERYLPSSDRDLNRAFPGKQDSTSAKRIAAAIFEVFIEPCDFGIDFHTSTRGRTNMFHVRANMEDEDVARLARAFGTNVIVAGAGSSGTLRKEATDAGVPTITVEMGEAHRFERDLIDHALAGVRSVFAEYDILLQEPVRWPGWRTVIDGWIEKTWLRADAGGIVEMCAQRGEVVRDDEVICRISSPFKHEVTNVRAPFTGIAVGILKNPVVFPGNPLCHFVSVDDEIEQLIATSKGNGQYTPGS